MTKVERGGRIAEALDERRNGRRGLTLTKLFARADHLSTGGRIHRSRDWPRVVEGTAADYVYDALEEALDRWDQMSSEERAVQFPPRLPRRTGSAGVEIELEIDGVGRAVFRGATPDQVGEYLREIRGAWVDRPAP